MDKIILQINFYLHTCVKGKKYITFKYIYIICTCTCHFNDRVLNLFDTWA